MSWRNLVAPMVIGLSLVACASGSDGTPRLQPPSYASSVGDGDFEVLCGRARVYVMRNSRGDFDKPDGSQKTHEEFCTEYRPGTVIGR